MNKSLNTQTADCLRMLQGAVAAVWVHKLPGRPPHTLFLAATMTEENSPHTTALILSLISGLSTGLGGLCVCLFGNPSPFLVGFLLSFASGVMMYVSFLDLLPESIDLIGFGAAIFFFLVGMLLFDLVIKLVPEPDPSTLHSSNNSTPTHAHSKLIMTSIVVVLGISLHNLPEGMAVYLAAMNGWKLGLSIAIAIGLHNIPEGIAVAVSIYAATQSKMKALQWALISGMCEPLGAAAYAFLFYGLISKYAVYCQLAAVAGIMSYISIKELIPNGLENMQGSKLWCLVGNLCGAATIYGCSRALDQLEQ